MSGDRLVISFWRRLALVGLALLHPQRAAEECARLVRNPESARPVYREKIDHIRRGFGHAFLQVVAVFVAGGVIGWLAAWFHGQSDRMAAIIGTIGVLVLLWATLAVQGWNVQTTGGTSPPEQINQSIFRGLYLFGTLLAVTSGSWTYFGR